MAATAEKAMVPEAVIVPAAARAARATAAATTGKASGALTEDSGSDYV